LALLLQQNSMADVRRTEVSLLQCKNDSMRGMVKPSGEFARRFTALVRTCVERDGLGKAVGISSRNRSLISRIRTEEDSIETFQPLKRRWSR
jgi:hypothetical protein